MADARQNEYNDFLRSLSVEDIESQYKDHRITAEVYHKRLRAKARLELSELEQNSPFISAVWQQSAKNFMEGWKTVQDNMAELGKAEAQRITPGNVIDAQYKKMHSDLQTLVGMAQMAGAFLGSGLSDVFGMRVENNALKQGYSPGAAWAFGQIAGIATGFAVPVGGINKLALKTAQATGIAAKFATTHVPDEVRFARGLAEGADITFGSGETQQIVTGWAKAITKGLQIDGVENAPQVVSKAIETTGVKVAPEVLAGTEKVAAAGPSVAKAAEVSSELPQALAGAKPRFGYGERQFQLEFKSDIDRALYIVAQKNASTQDAKYMEWLQGHFPDARPGELRAMGRSIKDELRGMAKEALRDPTVDTLTLPSSMVKEVGQLKSLAKAALAPNASQASQTAFAKAVTEAFTGEGLNKMYSKDFADILSNWDPTNVAKGDIAAALKTLATDIASADPQKSLKAILRSQEGFVATGKIIPMIRERFINSLLPLASVPAFIGNAMGVSDIILERALSGHLKEAGYGGIAMAMATGDALRQAGMVFTTGGTRMAVPGPVGRGLQFIGGDAMLAMDQIFKTIAMRGSLYMDGMRAGLKGKALLDFVENPPGHALQDAAERAYRATYQNDLGQFGRLFGQISRSGPGQGWFYFLKSPTNLVKYGWDRTPVLQAFSGRLWADMVAGGSRASDAWARLTMSQLQAKMVWEFSKAGYINGSGPIGLARKAWDLTHKPYTVNAKDGMIDISNYDPKTMPITLVADAAQIADQLDEASAAQLSLALSFAFMANIGNRTAWRTLNDLVQVVQGRQKGEKFTQRDLRTALSPLTTAAAGGVITQRLEGIIDPVQRDARNVYEEFARRTPWFGKDAQPIRNGLGDVVFRPQPIGSPWFGFFTPLVPKVYPYTEDRVAKEAARLQATLPTFPDYIGQAPPPDAADPKLAMYPTPGGQKYGVAITGEERSRWQELFSNVIRHDKAGLAALIDSPEYQSWPLARQRDEFNAAISRSKSFAKDLLLIENTELAKKLAISQMDTTLPRVDQVQTPQVVQGTEKILNSIDQLSPEALENVTKYGVMEPDQEVTQPGFDIMGMPVQPRTYAPRPMTNIKVVP